MQATATTTKPTSTRTLSIHGMTGNACVTKVTDALKGVSNVTTHSVKVGTAVIASDQAACDAACKAVTSVGYKAHEQNGAQHTQDAAAKAKADSTLGTESPQSSPQPKPVTPTM